MRASEPSPLTRTPATCRNGSDPRARARASFRKPLHFPAPRLQGGTGAASSSRTQEMPSPDPPAPLPALAPYLEKLRDFPPGQIVLGIVGVHGCAARAWGRRRGGSRVAAIWAGAGRVGAEHRGSPDSHAQTLHTQPCPPGQGPLRLCPGAVVSALPPPWPRCWSPRRSCGLAAAASRAPSSAAAGRGAEGAGEADGAAAARQQPTRLSGSARRALRLPEPGLRRRPVTLRGRARGAGRGWGPARTGGWLSHPRVTPPPGRGASLRSPTGGRSNLGPGGQRNRNLRHFRFSRPSSTHRHTRLLLRPQGAPRKKSNCPRIYS